MKVAVIADTHINPDDAALLRAALPRSRTGHH
jgi:hypothetical protein